MSYVPEWNVYFHYSETFRLILDDNLYFMHHTTMHIQYILHNIELFSLLSLSLSIPYYCKAREKCNFPMVALQHEYVHILGQQYRYRNL